MSKGGAGKVYFVLYLAVILELLIIFIERDEAEEGLRRQQRQAIQIVQTILSQLQTGSGSTGITASQKDNIVLDAKEAKNNERNYNVFVAVGDAKAQSVRNGKTIKGDDVSELDYLVSFDPNITKPEDQLPVDSLDLADPFFEAKIGTDVGGYDTPVVVKGNAPAGPSGAGGKYFILNQEQTSQQVAQGHRVKVFSVNFSPNSASSGWYRLRFASSTNKILGVTGDPKDDDTIRIGNIKLTVKQLRQVQKVLRKQAGAPGDSQASQVEKYIEKLLTPDAYKTLAENKGGMAINIKVVKPDLPPPPQPFAQIASPRDTIYWLNVAPFRVVVSLGPNEANKSVMAPARMEAKDAKNNQYYAVVDKPEVADNKLTVRATTPAGTATDEKILSVDRPRLRAERMKDQQIVRTGVDAWRGLSATYGVSYDPSSDWNNPQIPADHYQTVVWFKGVQVMNRVGTNFKALPPDVQKALMVPEGMKPEDIVTKVFWKPGGTADSSQWVMLLCNQQNVTPAPVIGLESKKMSVGYRKPELVAEQVDFVAILSPRAKEWKSPQFGAIQRLGNTETPVGVQANCNDCAQYGLVLNLEQEGDKYYLTLKGQDFARLLKNKDLTSGNKTVNVDLQLQGRGEAKQEAMTITVSVQPR
ncbi:MAG: hypothetical protein JST22_05675 [Bacteroidetes bacterium]|nr:hypothetical protein [Bacteroidota bacterium]